MARFESKYKALVLQDEKGVWAEFTNGVCETTDSKMIERLRKADDVSEVAEEKAPAKKAAPRKTAGKKAELEESTPEVETEDDAEPEADEEPPAPE